MSRTCFAAAITSLLVLSGTAFADQFYFSSPGSTTWDGIYVNPYSANDNTQPGNNPLTVYCDDWNTDFSGNPTWNANVYALTLANLSDFKYGDTTSNYNLTLNSGQLGATPSTTPNAFQLYLEAAWLDSQVPSDTTQQVELAAAMWTLFVDSSHVDGLIAAINTSGYADAVWADLQGAQNAVSGGYTAPDWYVIVPEGNSFPMQEFLADPLPSVPEPSAVILLATIAGLLGFQLRRKRQV